MVKDLKNGECFRLDHLIKAALEKVCADKKCTAETKAECEDIITKLDGATKEEQAATMKKFNIRSPVTNNELSEPIEFNCIPHPEEGVRSLRLPCCQDQVFWLVCQG